MSVFNSLGSNYKLKTGAYTLFANKSYPKKLETYLHDRYKSAKVMLTYKGREAIYVALSNLDLPKGSHVVVNGYTCYAVYQAIVAAGLHPFYLDIEKDELNFSAKELEDAFKQPPYITAVMVQNTFGIPCEIEAIRKICNQHNAVLIEDLAHSIGMVYGSKKEAGMVGDAAALSFSQDKMIDAVTGGAVLFNQTIEPEIVEQHAPVWHRFTTRLYPWTTFLIRKTFSLGLGRWILKASKMAKLLPGPMGGEADPPKQLPAWHSKVALKSYKNLTETIAHRQRIAAIYREHLPANVQFNHHDEAVYLRFPIKVDKPRELIEFLKRKHIYLHDRWYDAPVAPKRFLANTDYKIGRCPNAEQISEQIINLPTHINVGEAYAHKIVERINQWLEL